MGQAVRTYFGLISCHVGSQTGVSYVQSRGCSVPPWRTSGESERAQSLVWREVDRSATPSECSFLLAPYPAWPPQGHPKLEHLCPGRCPVFAPRDETQGICVLVPIWGISADTGIREQLFSFSLLFSEDCLAFWENSSLWWGHRCTIVTSGQYKKGQVPFLAWILHSHGPRLWRVHLQLPMTRSRTILSPSLLWACPDPITTDTWRNLCPLVIITNRNAASSRKSLLLSSMWNEWSLCFLPVFFLKNVLLLYLNTVIYIAAQLLLHFHVPTPIPTSL